MNEPKNAPQPQMLLTIKQAAERLGLCPRTVYALIDSGRLQRLKIGRAARIAAADLAGFVANLQSQTK